MMLDHLDDPVPFVPSPTLTAAVVDRGRRLRRRRRLFGSGVSVLVLSVGVLGGGALYVERRDAAIDRTELRTSPSSDGAVNVLLVGIDASSGERGRADTMVIVRFEAAGGIRLLSIPRDLWDEEAGARLNEAGGSQGQIDAVRRVTGLPIDHFVELRFDGFKGLIDKLGGLPVQVAVPLRDASTGVSLGPSACVVLDGEEALALVRSRRLEYQDAGVWHADPRGELGRIERTLVLSRAMLAGLGDLLADPVTLDRLSRVLADHAALDDGLSISRMTDLARRVAAAGPEGVGTDMLPVRADIRPNGANVVQLADGADDVLATYGAASPPETVGAPVEGAPLPELLSPC